MREGSGRTFRLLLKEQKGLAEDWAKMLRQVPSMPDNKKAASVESREAAAGVRESKDRKPIFDWRESVWEPFRRDSELMKTLHLDERSMCKFEVASISVWVEQAVRSADNEDEAKRLHDYARDSLSKIAKPLGFEVIVPFPGRWIHEDIGRWQPARGYVPLGGGQFQPTLLYSSHSWGLKEVSAPSVVMPAVLAEDWPNRDSGGLPG